MKTTTMLAIMLAVGLWCSACEEAETVPAAPETPVEPSPDLAPAPATQPTVPATQASAVLPANTVCPIEGGKVDPKGKTVMHDGKLIAFCCDDCVEPFQKEPAKYVANIK